MFKRYALIGLMGVVALAAAAPASATITFNGRTASTVTLSTNTSAAFADSGLGLTVTCTTFIAGVVPGTNADTATVNTIRFTTSRSAVVTSCGYVFSNTFTASGATVACPAAWRLSSLSRTSGEVIVPNTACTITFDAGGLAGVVITVTASTVTVTWRQDADRVGGILCADPNNRVYTRSALGVTIATQFQCIRDTTITLS